MQPGLATHEKSAQTNEAARDAKKRMEELLSDTRGRIYEYIQEENLREILDLPLLPIFDLICRGDRESLRSVCESYAHGLERLIDILNTQMFSLTELTDDAYTAYARVEIKRDFAEHYNKYAIKILETFTEFFMELKEIVDTIKVLVDELNEKCREIIRRNELISKETDRLTNFYVNLNVLFRLVSTVIAKHEEADLEDTKKKLQELSVAERDYQATLKRLIDLTEEREVLLEEWREKATELTALSTKSQLIKQNIRNFEAVFQSAGIQPKLLVEYNRFELFSGSEISTYGQGILAEPEKVSWQEDQIISTRFRELKTDLEIIISDFTGAQSDSLSDGEKRAQRRLVCALDILVDPIKAKRGRTIKIAWQEIICHIEGFNVGPEVVVKMERLAMDVAKPKEEDDPKALLVYTNDPWGRPFVFFKPTLRGRRMAKKWSEFDQQKTETILQRKRELDAIKAERARRWKNKKKK